ncbi:MAG: hypothetical protein CSB44_03495 [Gammaproteobacteria bacterium]|nr:MAG: hypothetical protein CSB44_03495 [Gammaproteobacteria bacterium]PIE34720.1 MAG: hypothetical protein CSA54_06245 [Gammaproteobacteria bacterium]
MGSGAFAGYAALIVPMPAKFARGHGHFFFTFVLGCRALPQPAPLQLRDDSALRQGVVGDDTRAIRPV